MQIRTVQELASRVANDPALAAAIKENPALAIANTAAPLPDNLVYRIVVGSLGLTVLVTVVGAIVLVAMGKGEIPVAIVAIGATAVGALAGLLAPAPNG